MKGKIIAKLVLGGGTYTYSTSSTNRLWRIKHSETPWSQTAEVTIDDANKVISALSLQGLSGVISYGYNTSAGDEYSACAPLRVKSQEMIQSNGSLRCILTLYGIPDQLNDDHASVGFSLESGDIRTVKTLITAIAGATLTPFTHCAAFTVTYDSEDSLIDTFIPADYFRIAVGQTRLSAIKELLSYTKCVMRAEDDGEIHIFSPTVSGTSYNYSYNNTISASNHTFFSKVNRVRLILPNKITVKSDPSHTTQYTGNATDATSYALLPKEDYITARLASDAQATAIATAMIQKLQVEHEKGNGFAPMNVGQEVHDYINITDTYAGDSRAGNVGYITRTFDIDNASYPYSVSLGFGDIYLRGSAGFAIPDSNGSSESSARPVTTSDFLELYRLLQGNINAVLDYIKTGVVPRWYVTRDLRIPMQREIK